MNKKHVPARTITWFAILLTLVIVLQLFAATISLGFANVTLTLIPIVLGGLILGPLYGGVLGFIFGFITLLMGILGRDYFTAVIFADHPILTTVLCLGKATAAGLGSGYIYLLFKKKNKYIATFLAAGAAPVINTGLFIVGALTMSGTLNNNLENFGAGGQSVIYFLVIGCAGLNFIMEFLLNMICAPTIYRVCEIVEKRKY